MWQRGTLVPGETRVSDVPYVLACVLLPAALGSLMFAVFELWDRRRRAKRPGAELPRIDYSI
ncbi:MAG: hypothetical protein ABW217_17365 [Polyangiaceae bacterium]